ncbi:hypothetical protein K1W54_04305 [Micromonospora sp. CPCC 205371]|nr:hypothetical protein [Micromonospora sp. CPCC 205371]
MKVITVTVEDRHTHEVLATSEFTDLREAAAAEARVRAWYPDALIIRSEQEVRS